MMSRVGPRRYYIRYHRRNWLAIAVEMAPSNDQDQWKLREISNGVIGRFGYLLLV